MGCGSSKSTSTSPSQRTNVNHNGMLEKSNCVSTGQPKEKDVLQSSIGSQLNNNDQIPEQENHNHELANGHITRKDQEIKENVSQSSEVKCESPPFKGRKKSTNAVAFEVKFEENTSLRELRRPPKLQKLDHLPLLTAEMLAKKQALAEENRQKEIQKKLAKTSRRKKLLLEARELDKAQERKMEIEAKMNAQNRKRAKAQAEIIEKQRQRELRAKRVREKAQRIREGEDTVTFEVDRDETYNADEEDDVWETQPINEQHKTTDNSISSSSHLHSKSNVDSDDEQTQDPKSVHDFFEE